MIQINQTKFHNSETKESGNCYAACIASILEKDINDVPNVLYIETWTDYLLRLHEWLHIFDLCYIEVERSGLVNTDLNYLGYHLICGKGPRKKDDGKFIYHAVVGYKGVIKYDPHPSREGLNPEDGNNPYYFGFILQNLDFYLRLTNDKSSRSRCSTTILKY